MPLGVAELVKFLGGKPEEDDNGEVLGLGMSYDEIVDVLSSFCDTQTIPATFIAEDLTGKEDYGEEGRRERRESEF